MNKIICFGEILWDNFPNYKVIGGAPLNVAVRLKSFKNNVAVISRVGVDEEGSKLLDYFKAREVNVACIQVDETLKTGVVDVSLNKEGSASYDISYPSAWDKIELTNTAKKLVTESDALVFGSLAARDAVSRETLFELLEVSRYKILDVNLRPPHYNHERVLDLMHRADFIKLNDEELEEIIRSYDDSSKNIEQQIQLLSEKTNTKIICVTRGGQGAILFFDNEFYYNQGHDIDVVDTVGAGDSFLAGLIDQLLKGEPAQKALNFASAIGACVASKKGANPEISKQTISTFL